MATPLALTSKSTVKVVPSINLELVQVTGAGWRVWLPPHSGKAALAPITPVPQGHDTPPSVKLPAPTPTATSTPRARRDSPRQPESSTLTVIDTSPCSWWKRPRRPPPCFHSPVPQPVSGRRPSGPLVCTPLSSAPSTHQGGFASPVRQRRALCRPTGWVDTSLSVARVAAWRRHGTTASVPQFSDTPGTGEPRRV